MSSLAPLAGALLLLGACPPAQQPSTPPPEPPPVIAEPAPAPAPDTREAMDWSGQVETPGAALRVTVHLTPRPGERWDGTIDIPQQGVKAMALRDVDVRDEGLDFVLAPPGLPEANWALFSLDRAGGEARGALEQGGRSFPMTLRRLAPGEAPGPRRPQTPRPPLPYPTRDLAVKRAIQGGEVSLACTLALPAGGEGPSPAVVLLTGSGAQDRDEAIFDHRPFAVIADHLARGGIASLRCDDRGVGGSTGTYSDTPEEELALDALAMIDAIAGDPAIRGDAIGLLGHSEGAIIAPQAAAGAPKKVAFLVLLAGPAIKASEILVGQIEDLGRAAGKSPEAIAREVKAERALLKVLTGSQAKDTKKVADAVEALVTIQTEGQTLDAETRAKIVDQTVGSLRSPWFLSFLRNDPAKWLRKAKKIPTLALNGELDLQVRASVNLPAMKKAMAGAKDLTTEALPGLNHLFQPATKGGVEEYEQIEVTIAPAVLDRVTGWVREKTTVKAEAKPEAGKGEAKAEAAKPEPAKPEPAKAEAAKPEPAKPEPAKPEPAKPEPAKPEPAGEPPPMLPPSQ
ncbi:MAG: alpha/beta fold hydrolase [Nannocystaceae bacterium]